MFDMKTDKESESVQTERCTIAKKPLFWLAVGLIAAGVVIGIIIYHEGSIAEKNAEQLLEGYEQEIAEESYSPDTQSETHNAADFWTYENYEIIGKLAIEKTKQELPVIARMDDEALKVSCCYYQGALPGKTGNMVITGHNYKSGSIFGRIDELEEGDSVMLSTQDGNYTYKVYGTEIIKPDDVQALDEYEGDMALTLLTCASDGNRRLLVRCRIDD